MFSRFDALVIVHRCASAGSAGASSGNEVRQRGVRTGPRPLQIPASASSRRSVSRYKDLFYLVHLSSGPEKLFCVCVIYDWFVFFLLFA